jgi:hypothetical protein
VEKRFISDLENFKSIARWINKATAETDLQIFKDDLWLLTSKPRPDQRQNFKFIDENVLGTLCSLGYVTCKNIYDPLNCTTTRWYSLASVPYTLVLQKALKFGSDRQLRQRLQSEVNPANMGTPLF